MKKLLLSTVAVCGLAAMATPASAEVDLNIGGYFKGYGVYSDQDEAGDVDAATAGIQTGEVNEVDFIRDTEIHLSGENTLDNGLTVGAHFELDVDGTDSATTVDESYIYMTGAWGRINAGDEDGVAYLLQVSAPSADENIDGIRQYVQPVNYGAEFNAATLTALGLAAQPALAFDYDHDPSGKSTKLSYMTPIFSGFQAGVSYTPDSGDADDLEGVGFDDVADTLGATYEVAARYEGQFDMVGVIFGAGYTHTELEEENNPIVATDYTDDREAFNVGLDLDIGAFGIGAAYMEDDYGETSTAGAGTATTDDEETLVVGADYTTGPFKLGVSYFDQDNTAGIDGLETQRYSGGVTYTYGPGMTFRGSVGYIEHEADANIFGADDETEATYVTLGTQINF